MQLIDRVKQFIRNKQLVNPGDTLIVGISGGADSVALALILNELKHELGAGIRLAHFDHGLRPESGRDAAFVRSLAARLNIPHVDEKSSLNLKDLPGSLEDNAREARLEFLVRTAQGFSSAKVALAHHKDDLAETVLMRILRGSGLQGLRAIRPLKMLKGMMFIRPLLCADRREIEEFLKERKQDFCHDATNDRMDMTRNRIRGELLPLLKVDYNPNMSSALANLSETVAEDYDYLEALAREALDEIVTDRLEDCFKISMSAFLQRPVAMQRLILRLAVQDLKGDLNRIEFSHWAEAEELIRSRPDGSVVHWPAGILVRKDKAHLTVTVSKFGLNR